MARIAPDDCLVDVTAGHWICSGAWEAAWGRYVLPRGRSLKKKERSSDGR